MPIRIQSATKDISVHKAFWNTLTKHSDTLALSQLWLCGFDDKKLKTIGGLLQSELPKYEPKMWPDNQGNVNNVVLATSNYFGVGKQGGNSYLLTQGMSIIGDGLNQSRSGINTGSGSVKGLIIDSRLDLNAVNLTFLESNVSFVDGFLRPWSVLAGHKSIKFSDLRCNIELMCLEKWETYTPLKVRKSVLLRNAVPINIDAEEYNYSGDKLIQRQVQFAFDRYDLKVYPEISYYSLWEGDAISNADLIPVAPSVTLSTDAEALAIINPYPSQQSTPTGTPDLKPLLAALPTATEGTPDLKPVATPPPTSPQGTAVLGTKNYQDPIASGDGGSLLQSARDLLGNVNAAISNVRGIANDVSSGIAQGLQAFGADQAANNVTAFNQRFQNQVVGPAANVIGTGQSYVEGAQKISNAVNRLTGVDGKVTADQAAGSLTSQAKNATANAQKVEGPGQEIVTIESLDLN